MKIAVIGTGIAGLASAARLAAKGHKVTCFEANSYFGGKLTAFETKGYRFDAGPSLFTLPYLVDEVFLACNKNPRDYFNYKKLKTACHYFFDDGTCFAAPADSEALSKTLSEHFNGSEEDFANYLNESRKKYERVGKIFVENSLHKASTWLKPSTFKAWLYLPSYHLLSSMNKVNSKRFTDKNAVQFFNRYATYNGSNPYTAPGLLTMIPHLEFGTGTFLPEGGMHSITQSIYNLCCDLGVTFHFNTKVEKIQKKNNKIVSLNTADKEYTFDAYVCNADIGKAHSTIIDDPQKKNKILSREPSSSALVFYWGINKEFPELDLHNIFFGNNYEEEFNSIFKTAQLPNDPTIYINITSKHIKTDAPANSENWFVMINLPANTGYYTDEIKIAARKKIIEKINRTLNTNIENHIAVEEVLDPIHIEQKTGSLYGSLYGTSSNNRMAAFQRPANFDNKTTNLYYCGGSVHPGGGIPLCLNSAKIVSELIA